MAERADAPRDPRLAFRWELRLDNVLVIFTLVGALISGLTTWNNQQNAITQLSKDITRLDTSVASLAQAAMPRTEAKQAEAVLMDKISDARARNDQTNFRMEGIAREIKGSLLRIEEKLDRKADKPGR